MRAELKLDEVQDCVCCLHGKTLAMAETQRKRGREEERRRKKKKKKKKKKTTVGQIFK
jgi:hypothetical protein